MKNFQVIQVSTNQVIAESTNKQTALELASILESMYGLTTIR